MLAGESGRCLGEDEEDEDCVCVGEDQGEEGESVTRT